MDLSVIIPIYNTRQWLVRCLDSAIAAVKGLDAELILINDGSTDDSGKIAQEYADKYPFITYHYQENHGLSNARNTGIAMAKGKYLAFIDSDDMVADWIYRDMIHMAERNQTPLVFSNMTMINEKDRPAATIQYQIVLSGAPQSVTSMRFNPNLVYDTSANNKLILRSFWDSLGLSFAEGLVYEDLPVAFKLHWYAERVSVIHGFGYLYRKRGNGEKSITQQVNSIKNLRDKFYQERDVLAFIKERINEPGAKEILLMKEKWILCTTLETVLLSLYLMEPQEQDQIISEIGAFFKDVISKETLERASFYNRQKYNYLVSGNKESLLQIMNHKRLAWRNMPVIDLSGKPMLVLPEEIYKKSMTEAQKELQDDIPLTRIIEIRKDEDKLTLDMAAYYPRINVPDISSQKLSAYIYCEFSGERIDLPGEPITSPQMTKDNGTLVCMDDFRVCHYNYDGAGFRVTIAINDLCQLREKGRYFLGIDYATPIASSSRLVRSISPEAKNTIANELSDIGSGNGPKIMAKYDLRESFFFEVS